MKLETMRWIVIHQNDGHNLEFIALIYNVVNSWLWSPFWWLIDQRIISKFVVLWSLMYYINKCIIEFGLSCKAFCIMIFIHTSHIYCHPSFSTYLLVHYIYIQFKCTWKGLGGLHHYNMWRVPLELPRVLLQCKIQKVLR